MRRGGAGNLIAWQFATGPSRSRLALSSMLRSASMFPFRRFLRRCFRAEHWSWFPRARGRIPSGCLRCWESLESIACSCRSWLSNSSREAAGSAELACSLREILPSGEQLRITPQIVNWLKSARLCLTNQYGPTEAHVVSAYTLSGPPEEWPGCLDRPPH